MPHGRLSPRAAPVLRADLPEATLRRLDIYAKLLQNWQRVVNLVGASTLDALWIRHFADSLQVSEAVPGPAAGLISARGPGFRASSPRSATPDDPEARVHLVEADRRKCAFLQNVIRETSAPAIVHCGRLEKILPALDEQIDAVSARALAPLEALLRYAEKFIDKGAVGVFSKGKLLEAELTDSLTAGKYLIMTIASQTCPAARLVLVRRRAGGRGPV